MKMAKKLPTSGGFALGPPWALPLDLPGAHLPQTRIIGARAPRSRHGHLPLANPGSAATIYAFA